MSDALTQATNVVKTHLTNATTSFFDATNNGTSFVPLFSSTINVSLPKQDALETANTILSRLIAQGQTIMTERPGSFWYSGMSNTMSNAMVKHISRKYEKVTSVPTVVLRYSANHRGDFIKSMSRMLENALTTKKQLVVVRIRVDFGQAGGREFNHANSLLWHLRPRADGLPGMDHVVELFEPHGAFPSHLDRMWQDMAKSAKQVFDQTVKPQGNPNATPEEHTFTFLDPTNVVPLQSLQEGSLTTPNTFQGLCALWSTFIMEMAIAHPQLTLQEITEAIAKANNPGKSRWKKYLLSYMMIGYLDEWDQVLQERFKSTIRQVTPLKKNAAVEVYKDIEQLWNQITTRIGAMFENRYTRWIVTPAGQRISKFALWLVQRAMGTTVSEFVEMRTVTNLISRYEYCRTRDWAENCPDDHALMDFAGFDGVSAPRNRMFFENTHPRASQYERDSFDSTQPMPLPEDITAYEKMRALFDSLVHTLAMPAKTLAGLAAFAKLLHMAVQERMRQLKRKQQLAQAREARKAKKSGPTPLTPSGSSPHASSRSLSKKRTRATTLSSDSAHRTRPTMNATRRRRTRNSLKRSQSR
eukprot:gene11421-12768_t